MKIKNVMSMLTGLAIVGSSMLTTGAEARELRYAIGHPPGSYLVVGGEVYANAVRELSGGEMSVRLFPMSLLSMAETSDGLRDGLADIGAVMTTYNSSAFPHTNLALEASISLLPVGGEIGSKSGIAYAAAMTELVMLNCPECQDEFAKQGQVYTGGAGTPPYALNCTSPVTNLQEMQGKRLRIAGAHWSRWTEYVGATSISMSGNEMLEALSQGVLDCLILDLPDVYGFGLGESVTDITVDVPGGAYAASFAQVNQNTWQGLSESQKEVLLKASARAAASLSFNYYNAEQDVLERVREQGVRVHAADAGLLEKTREFAEQDVAVMTRYYAERHGVANGAEMLERFKPILDKWIDLAMEAEDASALEELYWREIYSNLDLASYGR